MLKYFLLAGAMTFAVPSLAQDSQTIAQSATAVDSTNPQAAGTPMDSTPTEAAPADATGIPAQTAQSSVPADQQAAAPATATAPASKADQVAQVVGAEFPTYDQNTDGALSKGEFGKWMVALKTASDPATKASSAETKTWIGQAFAAADIDKSKSVSKDELTGFLVKGA